MRTEREQRNGIRTPDQGNHAQFAHKLSARRRPLATIAMQRAKGDSVATKEWRNTVSYRRMLWRVRLALDAHDVLSG